MNKRLSPYDKLCELAALMSAYRQVRRNRGAAGVDQMTLAEFERDLETNLASLAARLREGRYYPMPVRAFELKKAGGGTRRLGILTVEDRLVQRAAHEALEPWFESMFLDCSFGFRPNRSTAMAVERVLDYRAAGDVYLVDADIAACFDSLDHDILMRLFSARIRDKRLQALVRLWLDTGQALPKSDLTASGSLYDRVTTYLTGSLDGAVSHLLNERGFGGYDYGYGAGELYGAATSEAMDSPEAAMEMRRQARKEALKRLGRDGVLLALTYSSRARKLLSPASLALTGAAVLATAAYPKLSQAVRQHFGGDGVRRIGAVQGGSISPLLANLYLHEFDVAMTKAGWHLVRYCDDFVITCRDEAAAQGALEMAAQKLAELRLHLHPQKTRITRFDEGLEFLGYRFDQFQNTATPISPKDTAPAVAALRAVREHVPAALAEARDKVTPLLSRFGGQAARQVKDRAARLSSFISRHRRGSNE